jgi:hypothetical protein
MMSYHHAWTNAIACRNKVLVLIVEETLRERSFIMSDAGGRVPYLGLYGICTHIPDPSGRSLTGPRRVVLTPDAFVP